MHSDVGCRAQVLDLEHLSPRCAVELRSNWRIYSEFAPRLIDQFGGAAKGAGPLMTGQLGAKVPKIGN